MSAIDTTHTAWPTCPHCGHMHRDAWEWNLGPGLDGDGEHECDECGQSFLVSRIVDVTYTTKARQ